MLASGGRSLRCGGHRPFVRPAIRTTGRSGGRSRGAWAQNVGNVELDRSVELVVGARARVAVGRPAYELGGAAGRRDPARPALRAAFDLLAVDDLNLTGRR